MYRNELKPGMFIKTRGARDGVGLRRIVEVRNKERELLVDHYAWRRETDARGNKSFYAVRNPYSSVVMTKKVSHVYRLDSQMKLLGNERVTDAPAPTLATVEFYVVYANWFEQVERMCAFPTEQEAYDYINKSDDRPLRGFDVVPETVTGILVLTPPSI